MKMKKLYSHIAVLGLLTFIGISTKAQTTINVKIAAADDDQEEWIAGANQTKTVGDLDAGSSDLELGTESSGNDPQIVGLRFPAINIPKGALITNAYIQFTVDATGKNTDPCQLVIKGQAADNPVTFNPVNTFDITSRPQTTESVNWTVTGASWGTVGSNGPDQRTPNLKMLVQLAVDRNGWNSGNALVFFITGTGTREVESADGNNPGAPQLVVTYITPTVFNKQITAADDDQEEWLDGVNAGNLDAGSSDLEFGTEDGGTEPQMVGLRFSNITIPKGSIITNAYIQFTVDATSKNTDPCVVTIKAENNVNPVTFNPVTKFDITSRPKSTDSVVWTVSGSSWGTVGSNGPDQRTPNLKKLVQDIVNHTNWNNNYAMAFYLSGTGTREVESADGNNPGAAKLVIEYIEKQNLNVKIDQADDDQEEWLQGANAGNLDAGSSDLEFGTEDGGADPQMVGLVFRNITIPQGAIIDNAYIQFTVDATGKNTDPCVVVVKTENNDNPNSFNPSTKFDISNRPKSADSVVWTVSGSSWGTVGSAGVDQRTPNLKNLIQSLINRSGWASGNKIALYIYGTGTREVESADGNNPGAARLVIDYYGGGSGSVGPKPQLPVTEFPVKRADFWAYHDSGYMPATNWKDTAYYGDTLWNFGKAILGYGETGLGTTLSFGGNANNKYITTYFRKKVNVADITTLSDTLEMSMRVDDGAIVYINGVEIFRRAMPAGTPANGTKASTRSEGVMESVYFLKDLPKTVLKNGVNIIAVEVHQADSNSSDLTFDLELKNRPAGAVNPPGLSCAGASDAHISCFNSVLPTAQTDTVVIPFASHHFQMILKQGDAYKTGPGFVPGSHDFTGYVSKNGSSTNGWLAVNHETNPGGVSILDLHWECATGMWVVDSSKAVDFGGELVKTERNCSGGITPWGTIITAEETLAAGDANSDGYTDVGWCIEIDPVTKRVKEYGHGKREKLWAVGRVNHENVVVANDSMTLYYGEDAGSGNVFKFIANQKTNLSSGTLYVLKLNSGLVSNEPTSSVGSWVVVPNTTQADRNNTKSLAAGLGGTFFNGVEDVEINPLDGKIYFTAKGNSRTYRFTDNGATVSNFETFVGGRDYRINTGNEIVSEPWGSGNDNLTFDDRGNLWVLQDGGRNHVWMVRPDHTQANPKVELFMVSPFGSEPTGMTFSPDYKHMFISIQGPSGKTNQVDVEGKTVKFDKSATLVISRRANFMPGKPANIGINGPSTAQRGSTQNYSVANVPGATFNWAVTGGTLVSGANTNTVSVQWGNGMTGSLKVVQNVTGPCKADTAHYLVALQNVGVSDVSAIEGLKVYPNPVRTTLTIESANAVQYEVVDMAGRVIASGSKDAGANGELDVTALSEGVYVLRVNESGKVVTLQFIKN